MLEPDEAERLIEKNPRNKDVVFPYLNGEDLNSRPDQSPSRWVIDFFDWPLNRETAPDDYSGPVAADYADCLAILEEKVKPERTRLNANGGFVFRKPLPQKWWIYADKRPELYRTIAAMERVLVLSLVSNKVSFVFVPNRTVYAHKLAAIALDDWVSFAVLQSNPHYQWVWHYCSTMRTDLNYSPSDGFETFPFPCRHSYDSLLAATGEAYHCHRGQIMLAREEGLTRTYNRFHDPEEPAADLQQLRDLHVEMDQAIAVAYGWSDLDLEHGFHETKQGIRFTISEPARREVLARLLKLNHERYAEEVERGLHDKKGARGRVTNDENRASGAKEPKAKRGRKSKASPSEPTLFGDDEDAPDPAGDSQGEAAPISEPASAESDRPDHHVQKSPSAEPVTRSVPIDEFETDKVMAAFRQAARGRGWMERDELLKDVSLLLGYQRLGPWIVEALQGHLRAAIRRRIIESDGPTLVRAGAETMADYGLDELREVFRSVMRKGTNYEREEVVHALARYLGFVRVTDTIRQPIKSAINSAIRHGILEYDRDTLWRNQ